MVEVGIVSTTTALEQPKLKALQDQAEAYQNSLQELDIQITSLIERIGTIASTDSRWAASFQACWDRIEASKSVSGAHYIALLEAFYHL